MDACGLAGIHDLGRASKRGQCVLHLAINIWLTASVSQTTDFSFASAHLHEPAHAIPSPPSGFEIQGWIAVERYLVRGSQGRTRKNRHTARRTYRQTYVHTDRQTYRHTYRQTDGQTDIRIDGQTCMHAYGHMGKRTG